MKGTINGKDVILSFKKNDAYLPFVCAKEMSIEVDVEKINTKTIGDGAWDDFDYQTKSYKIQLSSVLKFDDNNFTGWDMLDNMLNFVKIYFQMLFTNPDTGEVKRIRGKILVENSVISASASDLVMNDLTLPGSGAFTISNPADDCNTAINSISLVTYGGHRYIRVTSHIGSIARYDYSVDGGGFISHFPISFIPDLVLEDGLSSGDHSIVIIPYCDNGNPGSEFDGSFNIPAVNSASFKLDTVLANICDNSTVTLYFSGTFGPGTILYTDAGLSTPASGNNYVVGDDGHIYNLDASTAEVGADTTSTCIVGVPVNVILGNDSSTICGATPVTRYVASSFAPGQTLFIGSYMGTAVTGSAFVVGPDGHIYNLNTSTGVIGSDTGSICGTVGYDLVVTKEVDGDQVTVKLTNTSDSSFVNYAFNESGSFKTFSGVMNVATLYNVLVTVTPFGRSNAPISITDGTNTVVATTGAGTTLGANNVDPNNLGIRVEIGT